MRQMYFKRAKIFLEQTDKGEQRFIASVGGPVQVPNWVCKTLGYKYGIKDGSIVDVTPPKHVAPIVDEEEPTAAFPGSAQEAAYCFGYSDAVSMTTIGAGAVTYIVGPVTGAAIGASSDVIALSIATGLVKAILVMIGTPVAAKFLGLRTPRSAMVFGGLAGTVSGVSAGLAATDRRLVPYGALVATFHTGLGCFMGPSVLYFAVKAIMG